MAKRNITYLTDALLITCVVQKDLAEPILEAAKNAGVKAIGVRTGNGVEGIDEGDVVGVFDGILEGVGGLYSNP